MYAGPSAVSAPLVPTRKTGTCRVCPAAVRFITHVAIGVNPPVHCATVEAGICPAWSCAPWALRRWHVEPARPWCASMR